VRGRYRGVTLSVEDRHWWYLGRRRIVTAVLARLNLPKPARVLDAGCGGGGNLGALALFGAVTGLEPAPEAAAAARAREIGEVVDGSVEAMPFADGSFDVSTALDVIEHLDDDVAGLRELRRVTGPRGHLLVTVPAYQWLWGPHDVANEHRRRYARPSLLAAAEDAGWRPIRLSYFNCLLLPAVAAHRLLQRRRIGDEAPEVSDFERTPAWLDPVLELPLRAESAAIAAGLRIPAGLSLLGLFAVDD
jgi:SAM-dependent methyltransferase